MEDLWRRSYFCKCAYEPCSSCYSQAAAFLPHILDTNEGIQMQTPTQSMNFPEPGACIHADAPAVVILDALSTEKPHDSGLLGTASLGPVVQLDQTPEDNSSQALTQYWPKFVANLGDPTQILTCNSAANSLLDSSNPSLPPTRIQRKKKAAGGGGGDDHEASRARVGNIQKLVERQRRNKMKALCSTLISLLPEEYRKTKCTLSEKMLEAVKYISHLQDKVTEVGKKRDELKFMATVKPFSTSSCVYKNLQASQARPPIEPENHQSIRVGKFGPGIQVTVNTFKNQIELSILLMVLQEAGLEVFDATVSAINDRVFYSIQSKLSDFRQFDSAVLHGRIDHLMNGNLP